MKHLFQGLSIDERESLADLLQSPGWKPLLKVVGKLVDEHEQSVIKRNIDEGVDKLVHAKLRAEGARKLGSDIEQIKEKFKTAK